VGSGDSRVYSLAVDSGGEYWRYSTGDAVYAAPLVSGPVLYVASAGNQLAALDKISGKKIWDVRTRSAVSFAPLLVGDQLLYVTSGDPHLYAVDAHTGSALFNLDTGDWLASGPVLVDQQIFILGKDGTLLAYSR
jgi:outer membrane protein assembly factor BamB